MDGEEEGGDRPPRAEQEPEKRRDRSRAIYPRSRKKATAAGEDEPGRVVQARRSPSRAPACPADRTTIALGARLNQVMAWKRTKRKATAVEDEEERRPQAGEEASVGLRALGQRAELPQAGPRRRRRRRRWSARAGRSRRRRGSAATTRPRRGGGTTGDGTGV